MEFIPERPPRGSPDILARSAREEWFVECKRLQKRSAYSERERKKWLAMWSSFARLLTRHNLSLVFEITFHVELASLPDDYLVAQLAGKLPLLSVPCHIASNETWDVTARPVDYRRARAHLRRYYVRDPSDRMQVSSVCQVDFGKSWATTQITVPAVSSAILLSKYFILCNLFAF